MAFEQNQQDAFNLRNDTESLKRLEAELDKATTAIGAAEVAAEEELAAQKLKNLAALQEARLKKLNELIEKEEASIRKLAALRLELSDKQFEARKKEIQKELQLLEKAKKELLEAEVVKPKKSEDSAKKQAPNAKGIASESKAKPTISGKKIPVKNSGKSTDSDLIKLVSSIDRTLGSLRKTVTSYVQSNEKSLPADNTSQQAPTATAIKAIQATAKNNPTEATTTPKLNNVPIQNLDVDKEAFEDGTQPKSSSLENSIDKALESLLDTTAKYSQFKEQNLSSDANSQQTSISDSKNEVQPELINLVSSINRTLESLLSTVANQSKEKDFSANTETQQASTTKDIQTATKDTSATSAVEASIVNNTVNNIVSSEQSESASPVEAQSKEKEFSNDGMGNEDRIDLGQHTFESIIAGFDSLKKTLAGKDNGQTRKDLNSIIKSKKPVAQDKIDAAGELLKSVKAANEAEQKLKEFNEASVLTKRLRAAEEEHKLRQEHADTQRKAAEKSEALSAKAKDLEVNRQKYLDEARLARENAFAEEQNKRELERIEAEAEIEIQAAHKQELLAQEEQKIRLGYLAEYQQLQTDGFSHLTENMTKEQFIALKEQTAAAEKAIASREKASAASEKALATLRGKGTIAEKKALLEAQVKQRAAEKDWTGTKYEITDDMSEDEKAEIQKKRENATKAEMAVNAAMGALANFAQQLNKQTDKIGAKQAPIDTRLQGSKTNDTILGSYWKQLARDMNKIGAVNPYFTQEDFASNIETLVNKGISFDIKQRAFLMTIQEKIANTFDVADGTLLRLIRIQQQDTTAGRLGMESALNSFLNSMYETSEYLTDVASSVRGSLEELQSLMEGTAATELEFQIQKWMGSLYSVGMSQDAVQSIAQTFGQIASGDISGLTGDGTSNLLIMAANEAGMSIADILQKGLDADETNKLLQATVNYLAEIAKDSSDSRVVQQQLANVFGMKASDLRAATNLASSVKAVSNQDLTYSGMLGQLNKMANSMILRTSTGEMLTNVWDNVQYTMATQMANDPILYLLPRVATLLEDYAGGIDLPFINVWGFGLDLNTSVAQLMNVAALSGSILGSLGPMISGLSAAVSGSIMLSKAGIDTSGKAPVIARGAPATLQNVSGSSISESGYIGNGSGEDVKNATLQDAEDDKKKQMVEAKDESSDTDLVTRANQAVIDIYNLLEEVAHGTQSLRVHIVGGLTGGSSKEDNGNWVLSF